MLPSPYLEEDIGYDLTISILSNKKSLCFEISISIVRLSSAKMLKDMNITNIAFLNIILL